MKALELEKSEEGIRALVWDIDEEPPHYNSLIEVIESDQASISAAYACELHPDITHAKYKDQINAPDELSVTEAACAMAGIW